MQFNCDEVVSLIQKLCENIGAMDLQHDKASVTWIDIFLQMRVKELEDKVELWLGHLRLGRPSAPRLQRPAGAQLHWLPTPTPTTPGCKEEQIEF